MMFAWEEENYLYALAVQKEDADEAIQHYGIALQKGFSEFWVRYNRAAAFLSKGELRKAKEDIERARQLNPEHSGVKQYLDLLQMQMIQEEK